METEIENPFLILGIEPEASVDAINNAWKEKVKALHADRYPDAPPEIVAKLSYETAKVNAAHTRLVSELDRMRQLFGGPTNTNSSERDPSIRYQTSAPKNTCEVCGSQNTYVFHFTRQVGLIFARRVGHVKARLCKSCAQAIGREYQTRTLLAGWWGAISAFTNIVYILRNAGSLSTASRLADPVPPRGFRTQPLDPGNPVIERPAAWPGPLILGGIIVAIVMSSNGQTSTYPGSGGSSISPTITNQNVASWSVGNCVSGFSSVYAVPCSSPHSGRIVAEVVSQSQCPFNADSYVNEGMWVYCIDDDR